MTSSNLAESRQALDSALKRCRACLSGDHCRSELVQLGWDGVG